MGGHAASTPGRACSYKPYCRRARRCCGELHAATRTGRCDGEEAGGLASCRLAEIRDGCAMSEDVSLCD